MLRQQKDPSAADEAERALRRYPNAFAVVYQSAAVYQKFGIEKRDEAMLRRALTLLDRARQLLPQNTDRSIGEVTLTGEKAAVLCFDAAPSYRTENLRFVIRTDRATLYDDLGETAMAGVRRTVADIGDAALSDLWDEVDSDDEG